MPAIRISRNRPTPTHGRRWSAQRFGSHPLYCVWAGPAFVLVAWGDAARRIRDEGEGRRAA